MKKIFIVLGVIFLCIIIIGVIGFSITAYHGTKLDKTSKAYVDEVIPIIVSSWDSRELINRASPELLEVLSKDQLRDLFATFSKKLGRLKDYKESKGDALIKVSPKGKIITASYIAQLAFEKADAEVKIGLIQHNEKWQLLEFRVKSDAFTP